MFSTTPEDVAQSILIDLWDGKLPVDPMRIARDMRFDVGETHETDISGSCNPSAKEIKYNPNEPEVRRRFTVAHELGHCVLGHQGKDIFRDPTKNFSLNNYDRQESEANRFAAELLMPGGAVLDQIEKKGVTSLERLTEIFGVSGLAMSIRLKRLGVIETI